MLRRFLLTAFIFCLVTEGAILGNSKNSRTDAITRNGNEKNVTVVFVDAGSNYTLQCNGRLVRNGGTWSWHIIRDSHENIQNSYVREDGSLFFPALHQSDSGLYACQLDSDESDEDDEITKTSATTTIRNIISQQHAPLVQHHQDFDNPITETRVRLRVRTPPLLMKNVTVLPSTVLASVIWETGEDGGYAISSFQIRYRLKNESEVEWKICQPNYINPDKRHLDIFHLLANSTYIFEMWANNHLGKGYSTFVRVTTHNDAQEIAGKYLLEGVDTFDTRAWMVAVLVVLGTLLTLGVATACLFYKEYSVNSWTIGNSRIDELDGESIELMPNIILNPAYEFQAMLEPLEPDENLNDTTPLRVNNNSVIFPTRV